MKKIVLSIITSASFLIIGIFLTFSPVTNNNLNVAYGSKNFSGWHVEESEKEFFLYGKLTTTTDGMQSISIPIKTEARIQRSGSVLFRIESSDFYHETHTDFSPYVTNSLIKFQMPKKNLLEGEYDLLVIFSKNDWNQIPAFNTQPLIIVDYSYTYSDSYITNTVTSFKSVTSSMSNYVVYILQPIQIIIGIIILLCTLVYIRITKATSHLLGTIYSGMICIFLFLFPAYISAILVSVYLALVCWKSKFACLLHVSLLLFLVALIYQLSYSQIFASRVSLIAFVILVLGIVSTSSKKSMSC